MKKILLVTALMAAAYTGYAQDASAALQVDSDPANPQGFLMPRLADHTTISSPATGLQVYNTTTNKTMLFDGTNWVETSGAAAAKFVDGTDPLNAVYTSGNVGIGIQTPFRNLHVYDLVSGSAGLFRIQNRESVTGSSAATIEFSNGPSNTDVLAKGAIGLLKTSGYSRGDLVFALDNAGDSDNVDLLADEKMRITRGGNVGIGTAAPEALLDVSGGDALINGITFGKGSGASTSSIVAGIDALFSNTTGNSNIAVGSQSLYSNTEGSGNVGIGSNTLYSNTTGVNNVALGFSAQNSVTTGGSNVGIGAGASRDNLTGSFNTAIGTQALLRNPAGENNVSIGMRTLRDVTSGSNNVALGAQAGRYHSGGLLVTVNNAVLLGSNAKSLGNNSENEIVIGANAVGNGNNSVTIGDDNITKTIVKGNVGINTTTPAAKLDVNGAIKVGNNAATGTPGMIRYNSMTDKFQGYTSGSGWVDLH